MKSIRLSETQFGILDKSERSGLKGIVLDEKSLTAAMPKNLNEEQKSKIISAAKACKMQVETKVKAGKLPKNSLNGITHSANHLFGKIEELTGTEINFRFGKKKKVVRFD